MVAAPDQCLWGACGAQRGEGGAGGGEGKAYLLALTVLVLQQTLLRAMQLDHRQLRLSVMLGGANEVGRLSDKEALGQGCSDGVRLPLPSSAGMVVGHTAYAACFMLQ